MKDNTLSKLGGACSILVGISYVVFGITYLLRPAEQMAGGDIAQFLVSFAQDPTMFTLGLGALAVGAVLVFCPNGSETSRALN